MELRRKGLRRVGRGKASRRGCSPRPSAACTRSRGADSASRRCGSSSRPSSPRPRRPAPSPHTKHSPRRSPPASPAPHATTAQPLPAAPASPSPSSALPPARPPAAASWSRRRAKAVAPYPQRAEIVERRHVRRAAREVRDAEAQPAEQPSRRLALSSPSSPSLSWPSRFEPHAHSSPLAVSTAVKASPHAICTGSSGRPPPPSAARQCRRATARCQPAVVGDTPTQHRTADGERGRVGLPHAARAQASAPGGGSAPGTRASFIASSASPRSRSSRASPRPSRRG